MTGLMSTVSIQVCAAVLTAGQWPESLPGGRDDLYLLTSLSWRQEVVFSEETPPI